MSAARHELPEIPPPAFTGATLDRVATSRDDPAWIAEQLRSPAALAVAAAAEGVLARRLNGSTELLRQPLGDVAAHVDPSEPILLGLEDGSPLFAIDLEQLDPLERQHVTADATIIGLRDAGAEMAQPEAGLAAYLMALLDWHRRHRFCANCGVGTAIVQAGLSRRCPRCGASHFPRTDPVVIMLVEHAGRLLLGRRPGWPADRYSVLAGFVSPGETLEDAVAREVLEESGIVAYDPRYVYSQPWPFPSSLMLGFEARADGGEPVVKDDELEAVGWFPLHVVRAAAAETGPLRLPPPISIARYLIDRWLAAQP